MVFLVVDSSTGDLAHSGSATRRQLKITGYCRRLLKHALAAQAIQITPRARRSASAAVGHHHALGLPDALADPGDHGSAFTYQRTARAGGPAVVEPAL